MSSPRVGKTRQNKDICKLSQHYEVTYKSLSEFVVKFEGPKDSPYEGGVWNVRVELPDRYPFKSPSIGFMNKIYHPNIDEGSGTVCLDVINQTWTSLYDLYNIFDTFLPQLLRYPNPSDPLNGDAASLHIYKPKEFAKKVKTYIERYATPEIARELSNKNSASSAKDSDSESDSTLSDFTDDECENMDL